MLKFPEIVLLMIAKEPLRYMPPPVAAVLPLNVLPLMIVSFAELRIPPPVPGVVLPRIVLLVMVNGPWLKMPPALGFPAPVELFEIVQLSMVSGPKLYMPPPKLLTASARLSVTVQFASVNVPPFKMPPPKGDRPCWIVMPEMFAVRSPMVQTPPAPTTLPRHLKTSMTRSRVTAPLPSMMEFGPAAVSDTLSRMSRSPLRAVSSTPTRVSR